MIARKGRIPPSVVSGVVTVMYAAGLFAAAQAEVAPPYSALLEQTADAPRLVVSSAEVRRAEGLLDQADARPNPSVSILAENVAGSSPYTGFERAETTLQYSQPIELGGKRSARVAAGQAGVTAARARDHDARVNYAFDLARAYAAAEVADRRVALAEDEVEAAQADLRVARALVTAGKESRLRSLQAETALDAVTADLALARAGRIAALARLSALAGVEEPYTGLAESVLERSFNQAVMGPFDPLSSSTYLVAVAERDAADQRLMVERRRAVPDITVTVGLRRLNYEGVTAVMGGVTVPLHIFDRNRGNITASSAEAEAAGAQLAMARNDARAEAQAAAAQFDAAGTRVTAAEAAIATAEETYRLARIAYEAGKSPLVELLAARRGLGAARSVLLDARAARFEARARLARLHGLNIFGDPIQ